MGDRLALLCRVLNRWKERPCDFVPEQEMGVPGVSVSAVADGMTAKRYIDGRYVQVFPFAIRLVISGRDAREMVDALSFFDRCTAYLAGAVMELRCDRIAQATTAARVATGKDGTAAYTARYVMEYRLA